MFNFGEKIENAISEALLIDRSGSVVLEHAFRDIDRKMSGMEIIGLKETIGVACWYLWWVCRRRTHDEVVPPPFKCKMSILSITANAAKAGLKVTSRRGRWEKPDIRQIKVNVDGSFHQDLAGSVGVVVRDQEGNFIVASSTFLPNIASTAPAEAMAMREGLALDHRLGCNNVIMELDSLETAEACNGDEAWWGESPTIFADWVDLRAFNDNISFKHCPIEANEVAHEIASFCFSSRSSCNWVDEPFSFLLPKLINDVTVL
jgi:hypothetical protein